MRITWRPYRQIESYLDHFKPDIIQANNHYELGRALIRYGRKRGVPVVGGSHFMPETFLFELRHHTWLYNPLRRLGWRMEAGVYNKATAVVGPTKTAVDFLTKAGLKVPTHVISNGIDVEANQPSKQTKLAMRKRLKLADKPTVIYIGRLSAEKRLETVIEAVAGASAQIDLQFVMVGSGLYQGRLQKLADDLGIADRVVFTGFLEKPEQKSEYLAASDLFAIASPVELQSIVTLEAMACGLPVVAVDEAALPELVHPKRNGALFTLDDSQQLGKILIDLLSDLQRLKEYGKQSREIAETHDIRKLPHQYEDFYRQLLSRQRRSS
jgi:glycosyltransferase involved in cell wall biosynthesis